MRGRKSGINLLIIAEIIILVLVLALGGLSVSGTLGRLSGQDRKADAAKVSQKEEGRLQGNVEQDDENAIHAVPDENEEDRITFSDKVEAKLSEMTLEEKVAQLFVTTPEQLTGVDQVTVAGEGTKTALGTYPVGGLMYAAQNFVGAEQTQSLLAGTQGYGKESSGVELFLMVEEAGGADASPLASANGYDMIPSPSELGAEGDPDKVTESSAKRAAYLQEAGFNAVVAPAADTADGSSDEHDALTYGSEAVTVAEYVEADIRATQSAGLISILKGFPGLSAAADDYSAYQAGVDVGVKCIMVSNVTSVALTGDGSTPCSLSAGTVQKLRQDMGYTGLIMTDDLTAEGVAADYSAGDAAVKAVKSGMNLIYMPAGFQEAYEAVLGAAEDGTISMTQIENSVGRILTEKME